MTTPDTLAPPFTVSKKVPELIEAEVIASLNAAVSAWLVGTAVAPLIGAVEMTAGGVGAGTVMKVHT